MTEDICLTGGAIDRYRFLLEQEYPYEEAVRLACDYDAVRRIQLKLMLDELYRRTEALRLSAVQNTSTEYSSKFRQAFVFALDDGYSVSDAADIAQRTADTATAFTPAGNIARPITVEFPKDNGKEVYLGLGNVAYPKKQKMKLKELETLRKAYWQAIEKLSADWKPHILEFSLIENFGYIRVVCANIETVNWMEQTLPKLRTWKDSSLCLRPEQEMRYTDIYRVIFPEKLAGKTEEILMAIRRQNAGFDTSLWKIHKRTIKKGQPLSAIIALPKDSNEKLIAAGYQLNYYSGKLKFTREVDETMKNQLSHAAGYVAKFPDSESDRVPQILQKLQVQNRGLVTSEWKISTGKRMYSEENAPLFRLEFAVDAASNQVIKRANCELMYKTGTVKLVPVKLAHVEFKLGLWAKQANEELDWRKEAKLSKRKLKHDIKQYKNEKKSKN